MSEIKVTDEDIRAKYVNPNDEIRSDAGMLIVRYNPNEELIGPFVGEDWRPSCDYGVEVTAEDTVASVLRKNQKDIQQLMNDYFDTKESDKSCVIVSPQVKLNEEEAYCVVAYAGYESENVGEASALMSDQISHVIENRIPMDWHDYPVSDKCIDHLREQYGKDTSLSLTDDDLSFANELSESMTQS